MIVRHQRGIVLLSVSIALAIIAGAAYMANREATMGVDRIAMQRDAESARYLAEAGLSHAKWKANKVGCSNNSVFSSINGTLAGVGSYSASPTATAGNKLTITATGTTVNNSAKATVTRTGVVPHETSIVSQDLNANRDTSIKGGGNMSTNFGGSDFLVISQTGGNSNALLQFNLPGEVRSDSTILSATLSLYQAQASNVAAVSVHRVLQDWTENDATWLLRDNTSWAVPGGDYIEAPAAITNVGMPFRSYTWDLTPLVESWVFNGLPENGLMLKAYGPVDNAVFSSRQNNSSFARPKLNIEYRKAC
jgi:Tfp pilus assembly protein PilX